MAQRYAGLRCVSRRKIEWLLNKEQSQKYAIEILQDFIQNKLQYTSKNGMPTTT